MSIRLVIAAIVAFIVGGGAFVCQAADAPIGAENFIPSLEHPFGWRGDGTGRFIGATPPPQWSAQQNVAWSATVGTGYASPVVAGDAVFVTAEPDVLVCLNRADGKEKWRLRSTPADLPDEKARAGAAEYVPPQDGTGMAAATPITDGACVYIVLANGIVRAVSVDGKPKWISYIAAQQNTAYGRSASPVIAGGKLIVHMTHLYALDPANGRQLWVNTDAASSYGTPIAHKLNGVDVIITPAGDVVRASDGKSLSSAIGTCQYASPAAVGDSVYFAGTMTTAMRIDAAFKDKELWNASITGDVYSSPLLNANVLYLANSTGELWAFDAAPGAGGKPVIESRSLFGTAAYASITLAGDYLFVVSSQGETVVLEATRVAREFARNALSGSSGASPVFCGRDLFLRDGERLVCIRKP